MLSLKEAKKRTLHDPFIAGNNMSYFVTGSFPKEELKKILPQNIFLPSDEIMDREYPTVKKTNGSHPFFLMFSRCYNVHDVFTQIKLRPYLELLFYFPVIYRTIDEERLCSYLPVLYLDFLLGTLGGMFLGLRKEFHPKLKFVETETSNSFMINDFLRASFPRTSSEQKQDLNPFFTQILNKPTVTVSYFNKTDFYTTSVLSTKVANTTAAFEWNYKGSLLKNNQDTITNYCEYSFTTSWAMRYRKYFHP